MKLLKEIAEEHELDWDPAASETEFSKPHEDLLVNIPSRHGLNFPIVPFLFLLSILYMVLSLFRMVQHSL